MKRLIIGLVLGILLGGAGSSISNDFMDKIEQDRHNRKMESLQERQNQILEKEARKPC